MRFRSVVLCVACVLALMPAAQAQPAIEQVPEAINQLLTDYGSAYVERNEARLRGLLDPGTFAERELQAFGWATDVPFVTYQVRVTTRFSGDLALDRVKGLYPGRDVRTYHVLIETQLDIEDGTYIDDGAFTFVRDGEEGRYQGWRLASKTDLDVLAFFSPVFLWDRGPVTVLRSERFTALTHPGVAETVESLLSVAEIAYDDALDFWPRPVDARFVMMVPESTSELGLLIHATLDLDKFVAFVASSADRDDGWEPAWPRMFVHLSHITNYAQPQQIEILAHELIHAITRPLSGPHIPTWVEEGLANTGGGSGRPSRAGQGEVPEEFLTDDIFTTGDVGDIQVAYDQAQVAIEVLIDHAGVEGLADFYEALGAAREVAGTERYHVAQATRAIGWTPEAWLEAWQDALR